MLHSTQTTKKHIGNLILRFGMAGLLAAGLFFSAPYSAAAETVPSAENTDAGEITIHFTHYDAQDLEFYLNTDQAALAFYRCCPDISGFHNGCTGHHVISFR